LRIRNHEIIIDAARFDEIACNDIEAEWRGISRASAHEISASAGVLIMRGK